MRMWNPSPRYRPGRDRRAHLHAAAPGRPGASLPTDAHVVVVGGGIAGLSAATVLIERGVRVTVVERQAQLGGRVRSWPVEVGGSPGVMSRGFHAFFRQYYQLRALLRRIDPELSMLRPLADYPLVRKGGGSDSFAGLPMTPPANLAAFVARSPSFDLAGLRGVDVEAALGLLDVTFPRTFHDLDGVSAAELLDRLRFPESARHLALEVFARSFFADPREFSGAELLAMFHLYFVGSAEGLIFDVPAQDYDTALWRPMQVALERLGGRFLLTTTVEHVLREGDKRVVVTSDGERIEGDAVVLALDPPALRAVVAASTGLGDQHWRDQVGALRSAPRFAVWRLWLDGPLDQDRPPFLGTSGFGPVDNVSAVHLFEEHAALWAQENGGSVVEIHAYAVPDEVDELTLRAQLEQGLHEIWPETASRRVLHEEWLLESDCVLVGLEPWSSRPGVVTPDPQVVLAGDGVRVDLPVALMERAATTGMLAAAQLLTGWGQPGVDLWTVPMTSRPGAAPRVLRHGIRAYRRVRERPARSAP